MKTCACGLPLHYSDPATQELVERLVAIGGEETMVYAGGLAYFVKRHYIALHGLKASELPALLKQGIVRRAGSMLP